MPASESIKAPRRDAVRNRALLVAAAVKAFRDDGLGVSVNAIAAAAGVNIATLYRHFPTKEHLVRAAIEAILEPLKEAREQALGTPAGSDALGVFLRRSVQLQAENEGLVDALAAQPFSADLRNHLRDLAVEIVEPVVRRAHADHHLSSHFDVIDVLTSLRMLGSAAAAEQAGRDLDRYVGIILRGLAPS